MENHNEATMMDVHKAFERLEPSLPPIPIEQSALSIAISLKRIAKLLELLSGLIGGSTASSELNKIAQAQQNIASKPTLPPNYTSQFDAIAKHLDAISKKA